MYNLIFGIITGTDNNNNNNNNKMFNTMVVRMRQWRQVAFQILGNFYLNIYLFMEY